MMTQQQLTDLTTALLTLHDQGPTPHSHLYLAMDSDLERCRRITDLLTAADLITISRDSLVTITSTGRTMALELTAALALA
jgi:predicted transcriptional regulator